MPKEYDARGFDGVPKGGTQRVPTAAELKELSGPASDSKSVAAFGQTRALSALQGSVGSPLKVYINALTGTPRHILSHSAYLTQAQPGPPETIAHEFLRDWKEIFRFSDNDLNNLRLKSRATVSDMGTTIVLFGQEVDGIQVYKGQVLVNVNRAGQVINVGGESFPQLTVTNSFALAPEAAIASAAAAVGVSGFSPERLGTKNVPKTFGDLQPEFEEGQEFSGGGVFTDNIVVTRTVFPMGDTGRAAYKFVLTTPQYSGIMWENIVDAQSGEVLRRISLTSFQGGGGIGVGRRSTFRPDVQDMVEAFNVAGTAKGKVFDVMPTALSGPLGFGRQALGVAPTYAPNTTTTGNGRGFRDGAVNGRISTPLIYSIPFGQVERGMPDATNPTAQSPFGWFYLPTDAAGAEITTGNTNRTTTRAFGYTIAAEAKARNATVPANSPTGDGDQPFSATSTILPAPVALADGRTLNSVFQSNYTEGNNVIAADDHQNDNESTHGIKGFSLLRQFTAGHFSFINSYEFGGVDATAVDPAGFPTTVDPDVYPATVTLFNSINILHDYLYAIGFTEAMWNFQQDNFGKGGAGGDAVSGQVMDGSGVNNANFGTPSDGGYPRMQMFLWTEAAVRRADGDFDFDVVAHELYHGVSNRSVGKGETGCLGVTLVGESGGQGEGWSDTIAESMADDDTTGDYVTGRFDNGIRRMPATNFRWSYASINQRGMTRRDRQLPPDIETGVGTGNVPFAVHRTGEVWSATLWDMRELMIMKQKVGAAFPGVFFDGPRRLGTGTSFYIGERQVQSVDATHPIDYRAAFNNNDPAGNQHLAGSINVITSIVRPGEIAAEHNALGHRNGPKATAVRNGARLADTLVLRGMQLSPCNPSYIDSRDSILLADRELTGGENQAIIWRSFASHGIGLLAQSTSGAGEDPGSQSAPAVVEDFSVPAGVTQCEQLGPLSAPSFALSNLAPNQVKVTITPVVGAATYIISRASNANGPFARIAEIPAAQVTYDDNNGGQGLVLGQTYHYQVRASRNPECISTANTQNITITVGVALEPAPLFAGVDLVSDPKEGDRLILSWKPATSTKPTANLVYDIYRVDHVNHNRYSSSLAEPDPSFTPSASNRIAEGVTGTSFVDIGRTLNQVYYYIVQARDTTNSKKDTNNTGNTVTKWNAPTIIPVKNNPPFPHENFSNTSADTRFAPPLTESGNDPKEDQPVWQRVTGIDLGGGIVESMMYAPDFDPGSDGAASDIPAVIGPLTLTAQSIMDFDHFFRTEAHFDGGVIEIAIGGPNFNATPFPDNTSTFDLGDYMIEGGYNDNLNGTLAGPIFLSQLQGRRAFTGIKNLDHVRISLKNFAPGGLHNPGGAPVFIRFRMSSDAGTGAGASSGWYVDNLVINNMGVDATPTPTPTPTVTPTPTPTPTPTVSPTPAPSPTVTPTPNPSPTPLPTSIVQFSSTLYATTEACSHVDVQIIRSGATSGRVTVDLVSGDGTAKQKGDYTNAVSRITFEPGVTQKVVPVLTCEDSYTEGPESFTLTLSNPSGGATLGGAATTTVQINDDASETAANPIDDPRVFACQHYHDFLARPSDPSGEDFWTNETASCGADAGCIDAKRVNVSAAFFLSIEFQETGYFAIRAQKSAFGSAKSNPRYAVFLSDQRQLGDGVIFGQPGALQLLEQNKQRYLDEFVSRADFVTQFPEGSTAAFYVDKLFTNAGVTPTTTERNAAIAAYGSGDRAGRIAAFRSVVDSDAVFRKLYNPAFVLMQYYGYLRRNPDDAPDNNFSGYDFWLAKLESFSVADENVRDEVVAFRRVQRAEMVRSFLVSTEYRQRFGGSPSGNQQSTQDETPIAAGKSEDLRTVLRQVALRFLGAATSSG